MKSILVIDVPEDFDYRRCSIGGDGNIYYERKGEQRTSIIGNIKNLKPLPNKYTVEDLERKLESADNGYYTGWARGEYYGRNEVLYEILGGK